MAINFGQQINQALGQSLDRQQNSRVRAHQLSEQMKQRQFNQNMKQMVQSLRERQFQLKQEAQTEQIMQQAMENNLSREREDRLSRLTDARINNLNDDGSGGGIDPNTRVNALLSVLKGLQNQKSGVKKDVEESEQTLQEDFQDPILSDRPEEPTGGFLSGPSEEEQQQFEQELESFQQDSTRAANRVEANKQNLSQIDRIINALRGEIGRSVGVGSMNQSNSQNSELPELTNQSEFESLADGAEFIVEGNKYRKEDGQAVLIQ